MCLGRQAGRNAHGAWLQNHAVRYGGL